MDALKLAALDDADLRVISAHVQDSVCPVGNLAFDKARGTFVIRLNRLSGNGQERRLSVLSFARVNAVRTMGIDRSAADTVLVLLAILYGAGDGTDERIDLVFANDVTVRLDVECIEARLADTDAVWKAGMKPRHGI